MYWAFSSIKSSIILFLFWNVSLANISDAWVVYLVRKEANLVILIVVSFTLGNVWSARYLKEDQWLILWLPLACQLYEYITGILNIKEVMGSVPILLVFQYQLALFVFSPLICYLYSLHGVVR